MEASSIVFYNSRLLNKSVYTQMSLKFELWTDYVNVLSSLDSEKPSLHVISQLSATILDKNKSHLYITWIKLQGNFSKLLLNYHLL